MHAHLAQVQSLFNGIDKVYTFFDKRPKCQYTRRHLRNFCEPSAKFNLYNHTRWFQRIGTFHGFMDMVDGIQSFNQVAHRACQHTSVSQTCAYLCTYVVTYLTGLRASETRHARGVPFTHIHVLIIRVHRETHMMNCTRHSQTELAESEGPR